MLTKLAFFSRNIGLLGQSPLIAFDDKLTRLADDLFCNATTNRRTVFDLMQYLLAQKTSTGEQDSAIIPLFLRFSCLLPNGCLMSPEEVTRLCAKLNYGMKLSILETATCSHRRTTPNTLVADFPFPGDEADDAQRIKLGH